MKKNKTQYFLKKLMAEKESIESVIDRIENNQPNTLSDYSQELSNYDNHPGDLGTEMFMVGMQAALNNQEKYRLEQINTALENINNGRYGICNSCENNISEARLEIMPEANICISCAEEQVPAYKLNEDRPVEEEVLYPGFERTNMDSEDYTGFDGEDSYQAVAYFNHIPNDPSFSGGDHLGIFDDYIIGTAEDIENVSNEQYESQLGDSDGELD